MRPVDPRVLPLLAPARSALAGVVCSGVVGAALLAAQAFAVAALITDLLAHPGTGQWHQAAGWLLGITLARAAVGAFADLAASRAAGTVTTSLRQRVLGAALHLETAELSQRRSGELGLLATRGVAAVEPYLTRFLPTLVLAAVLPFLTVALILSQDLVAGVIVVATLPLVPVFAILIGLATKDRADRQYRTLSRLAGHFVDVVRGLPTLVTYNRAPAQSGRIRTITDRYRRATLDTLRLAFASSAALELLATLSVALVAVSVGLRLAAGGLDLRTGLVVLLLAPEAYWPLRRVGAEFHAAAEGVATLVAVNELLEEAETSGSDADEERARDGLASDTVDPVPLHLHGVTVRYPGAGRPALVLPDATVPAPGLTTVVGPSGCGKSTLVQAILGELPLESGTITQAGEPIDPDRWHSLVAQVPQTPWLTAGTIAENLLVGRPDAASQDLWSALTAVDLQEVVARLPLRLDTPLGEDGAGLSAGQRARLALARVVLANRPYVVLAEPTAHLDAHTEQVMLATLTRLAQHATVVVVAHRPAVIRAADHLIVVKAPEGAGDAAPEVNRTVAAVIPAARTDADGTAGVPAVPADAPDDVSDSGTSAAATRSARRRLVLATLLATAASVCGVALTATAGWLIAKAAEHPPVLLLMVAIVAVRTFGLARPALRYADRLVSHDAALRLLADTRARVYDVLVPLSPARLGRHRGDLLTAVVDDVDAQLDEQLRVRQPVLAALGTSLVAVVVAVLVHPVAAVPLVVVAFGAGSAALAISLHGSRRAEEAFVTARAALSAEVLATLQSARQLVLWGADDAALGRVGTIGLQLARAGRLSAASQAAARAVLLTATGVAVAATAWLTAPGLAEGRVSGPMTAMLVLLPLALHDVLTTLPEAGSLAVRTQAARSRLEALEALAPAVTEPVAPVSLDGSGDLRLTSADLGWTDRPVLTGLDVSLTPGSTVGVVGPSGSGKSTIAAALVRHLAPLRGHYVVEGHDAEQVGSAEVRRHVGLVDDDPYVFASSVRENLRLAAPDAGDHALVAALESAGLGAWYVDLPAGLDTLLGDGAVGVSGGERARLGIARALLADADVLVLDEPTAHLDTATAERVTETLLATRRGRRGPRGLVWITHEEGGLAHMEQVLTLTGHAGPGVVSGVVSDVVPGVASGVLERPVAERGIAQAPLVEGPVAEGSLGEGPLTDGPLTDG